MVKWPCLLKLEGDPELIVLACEQALFRELDGLICSYSDCLIDSFEQVYQFKTSQRGCTVESLDLILSLERVTQLIQEHQFVQAEVCLTKIQFTSIIEAIQSLA